MYFNSLVTGLSAHMFFHMYYSLVTTMAFNDLLQIEKSDSLCVQRACYKEMKNAGFDLKHILPVLLNAFSNSLVKI